MDFASLMSKEISKSKAPKSDAPDSSKPKYARRGDVEAARVAAYNEEQERLSREREEKLNQKRKFEDEEAERRRERDDKKRKLAEESRKKREEEEAARERERRKRVGLPEVPPTEAGDDKDGANGEEDISEEELLEKLRGMDEPAILFGETHKGRLKRYRRLVQRSLTPKPKMSDGPIPTTLELVPEVEMKIPEKVPKDLEGKRFLFRQLASYFNMVLKEWELALAKRDLSVKQSMQGRQAYNAMVQSKENMTPLFRKLEKEDIDDGVVDHVVEIVSKAQQRRYVDANDAYLRLSIGKAAWPIGVTMVGIHERSAREKLHQSDQQAHILSDESTRKYLQSIKRCLSFAQTRWPPDDQLQIMG
ncbi:pre-mRNA splicing factor [Aspergillus heteromorphus CBS 117.55]|uniref:Pre-mRNA-splicing factor 18 n=1 Tax=Aspergillus heteromorphus CBS 117.55 TaxID=1448321 RepID=A0A317WXG4_9EURO|nr:pre-mRNA splicing factor [Aspergillus heteromorphus CBS 117.55]PWY89907.1 pre-mRNA splicing factor [Aspergillus heteromorphus CBS 117.55]